MTLRPPEPNAVRRGAFLIGAFVVLASIIFLIAPRGAAAVTFTVPYSTTAVADADLDGDPGTGDWSGAVSVVIPLENGDTAGYGSATLVAKHDGAFYYLRIDGQIDVPWTSATGTHFWLGMQVSASGTSHHSGGIWDGLFFGLWDGTDYSPQPSYPPSPVDTNGFSRPPTKDGSQDAFGRMRYSGSGVPYAFTAEWKKKLNTGDSSDIAYAADDATTYNFFVTTDSNGGGSSGGSVDHNRVTNLNTMRFAATGPSNALPQIDLTSPDGGAVWSGGSFHAIWWNMSDAETATASLRVWLNYSTDGGLSYAPIAGAQGLTGLSNPAQFSWSVPVADTSQARVRATVMDAQGATSSDASAADFAIDATAPAVQAINPSDGSTDVLSTAEVVVTFTEPMNAPTAEHGFSLRRVDTGDYVVGTFSWIGTAMTFTPSAFLISGVTYLAQENATAIDLSDPGNVLSAGATSSFTIMVLPPPFLSVSVVPSVQESGQAINITAEFMGNATLSSVNVTVLNGTGAVVLVQALLGGPFIYWIDVVLRTPGDFTFALAAVDAGQVTTLRGGFTFVDTTPPVAVVGPDIDVPIGVTVQFDGSASYDNSAIENYTWSFTYNGSSVALYDPVATFRFDAAGQYAVSLEVVDSVGLRDTAGLNVTIQTSTTEPPTSTSLTIAAAGVDCLELDWAPADDSDLAGYRLYRWNETSQAFDLIGTLDASATSYSDCGLEAATTYSYWIVAFDAAGNSSPPSSITSGRISAGISPVPNAGSLIDALFVTGIVMAGLVVAIVMSGRRRRRPPEPKAER